MTDLIISEWKTIPETKDLYQASIYGDIKSNDRTIIKMNRWGYESELKKKGRILKPWVDSGGYYVVYLCVDGNRKAVNVHRLIALTFLPFVENKLHVNHIDGNKKNNNIDNLQWCNRSENMVHAVETGLLPVRNMQGSNNPFSNLTDEIIRAIRSDNRRQYLIAKDYGIHQTSVSLIKLRKTWGHVI